MIQLSIHRVLPWRDSGVGAASGQRECGLLQPETKLSKDSGEAALLSLGGGFFEAIYDGTLFTMCNKDDSLSLRTTLFATERECETLTQILIHPSALTLTLTLAKEPAT